MVADVTNRVPKKMVDRVESVENQGDRVVLLKLRLRQNLFNVNETGYV